MVFSIIKLDCNSNKIDGAAVRKLLLCLGILLAQSDEFPIQLYISVTFIINSFYNYLVL